MDNPDQIKDIIQKSQAKMADTNDKYEKTIEALSKGKEKISALIDRQLMLQLKWAYLETELNNAHLSHLHGREEVLKREIVVVKDNVVALEDEIYDLTTVLFTGYDALDIEVGS